MTKKNLKAQEEMIGFGLIIIVVAVILIVFLGISMTKPEEENVTSNEVDSFIQSFLQYTSDCQVGLEYVSIQKLVPKCKNKEKCSDGSNVCDVLNSTLEGIVDESWKIEGDRPVVGYELIIESGGEEMILIKKGNITKNLKGSTQDFAKGEIFFTAYY